MSGVIIYSSYTPSCRSQWPRGVRRRSVAARLLRSWVLIPPGAWKFVCCECCVLPGRGLCDELITRPEKSYRLWCVFCVWSRNLMNEKAMARVGPQRHRKEEEDKPSWHRQTILFPHYLIIKCEADHPQWGQTFSNPRFKPKPGTGGSTKCWPVRSVFLMVCGLWTVDFCVILPVAVTPKTVNCK